MVGIPQPMDGVRNERRGSPRPQQRPDVDWFFEQWLFRTGLPDLEIQYRVVDQTVEVTLTQTQLEPTFRLRVPIFVDGQGELSEQHVVAMGERATRVTFPIPGGKLRRIRIDPDRELLTGKKTVRKAPARAD
jgi:hypothetical protein